MTEQEFVAKATDLTKQIVNAVADKEYAKLAFLAQIDSSWAEEGQTQEEAFYHLGNGSTDNWQCGKRTKNRVSLSIILTNHVWKKSSWRRTIPPL